MKVDKHAMCREHDAFGKVYLEGNAIRFSVANDSPRKRITVRWQRSGYEIIILSETLVKAFHAVVR